MVLKYFKETNSPNTFHIKTILIGMLFISCAYGGVCNLANTGTKTTDCTTALPQCLWDAT
jgi:hypothetical protein